MLIQILITLFAIVALFGTVRRFRRGALSRRGLLFWLALWIAVGALVWIPQATNRVAAFLGVGRGADAVFYISVVVLFYAVFRLYGKIENVEHQMNEMVKKVALKDLDDRH